MKKLAIFDFDGTLADSVFDIADSGNMMLREMGFSEHPLEFYRLSIGDGMMKLLYRILPEEYRDTKLEEAKDIFVKIYSENCDKSIQVYDGIYKLLNDLKSNGIKTAVLSNKPHNFTMRAVDKYFDKLFDIVLGQKEELAKKPAPDGIYYMINQLGIEKSDCAYIGDSPVDVETAHNAGVHAFAVTWGMRPASELIDAKPDGIADTSEELKELILNCNK